MLIFVGASTVSIGHLLQARVLYFDILQVYSSTRQGIFGPIGLLRHSNY